MVYVQFEGTYGSSPTYTDDIVLDETAPALTSASLIGPVSSASVSPHVLVAHAHTAKLVRYEVHLVGSDPRSGISLAQVSTRRAGGSTVNLVGPTVRGLSAISRTVRVLMAGQPKYARVMSAAGKWSKWVAVTIP
jgi:hypothetical protein